MRELVPWSQHWKIILRMRLRYMTKLSLQGIGRIPDPPSTYDEEVTESLKAASEGKLSSFQAGILHQPEMRMRQGRKSRGLDYQGTLGGVGHRQHRQ
ncbi:uncharacterized protein CC84DRAFT_123154 [Paraphaeosphaeria sporulosa]|uniref:Uncharacterized protein n=1 Tax=Paraphaeosphaeria sporulosa TaxID=1460663 RepID=A0A177D0F6_9PLEO|nr:uncharacterized protein CC84DRAFT_123154 [Paraphaeosphaeria sporulosa]OAG12429.1 hypothetical protein CC84DRAFT_123154 [Paraphaeosphaeria sporulosa]